MVHEDCGEQLFVQILDLIEQEKRRSLKAGADPQELGVAMLTMVANLALAVIRHFCEDPQKGLANLINNISRHLPLRPPIDDRCETKH